MGEADFIWIEVLDPVDSDYSALQERFGLYSLAIEDSMSAAQIPKVDLYDDQIFVVLKAAHLEGDAIRYGEIDAFGGGMISPRSGMKLTAGMPMPSSDFRAGRGPPK